MSKLNLDQKTVKKARQFAAIIAEDTQKFINRNTTVSVERTVCRLLGVDSVNEFGVPYSNILVDHIMEKGDLGLGISNYLASAIKHLDLSIMEIAHLVDNKKLDLTIYPILDPKEVKEILAPFITEALFSMKENKAKRENYFDKYGTKEGPLLYVIVATGSIYEDVTQAVAAAKAGADIVAVIRTTGQSLLDYVPFGANTEGCW